MKHPLSPRAWVIFLLIAISYFLIAGRLFYWQIVRGSHLRTLAAEQYAYTLDIPAVRGSIFSQDQAPLVMSSPAYLVFAEPQSIEDTDAFVSQVSPVLGIDEATLSSKLKDTDALWMPLAHKVGKETTDTLKERIRSGIGFEPEPLRYYVESSMAAHVIGFVGMDENGQDTGYFGLEGYYDRQLTGKSGVLRAQKDVSGAPILASHVRRIEAQDGSTLILYLDRSVQHIAEAKLKEAMEKYGAPEGSVVIMDPHTGGILGMASYPNYDPSQYTAFSPEQYVNPVVGKTFEPGSTFKTLVMAAAINEGVVTSDTTMEETGFIQIGEYRIRTWDDTYHGTITMTQVLEKSSNVGMVFVANKLGKENMVRYLRDFGFGEKTGIDLQDEISPEIRDESEWKPIDLATASFGQGIAVTPIQMIRAVAAIANGGTLVRPRIVKEIIDARGIHETTENGAVRTVLSPKTAAVVTEMMVSAVEKGDSRWVRPTGYTVAGKTGTAQIPVAGHYDKEKTIASFIGFAPADDPKFIMLVTLREPSSSPWGSETAAPLFFSIARELLTYMNTSPLYHGKAP